jgi:parallel beta-helix repeat protein
MLQTRIAVSAAVVALLSTVPAWGTAQRTFVSHSGLDTNLCSIDSPCRSFAAAILQTSINGEIVVIDSAGYGPVTITKAVAIISPLGVHAGISVFSGDGVTVNAGATDVVVLRNLYINSQGGVNGITLNSAATLHIEHCVVSGFSNNDINMVPTVVANVAISDTVARQAFLSGIYADSASPLRVTIDHCRMESNGYGVTVDRSTVGIINSTADHSVHVGLWARGTGGAANMTIEASLVSNSAGSGVAVYAGSNATVHNTTASKYAFAYWSNGGNLSVDHCVATGGMIGVYVLTGDASVTGCTIADNTTAGISVGVSGTGRLTGNTITRNGTGILNSGGTVHSAGDNMVDGNTAETSGSILPANKA